MPTKTFYLSHQNGIATNYEDDHCIEPLAYGELSNNFANICPDQLLVDFPFYNSTSDYTPKILPLPSFSNRTAAQQTPYLAYAAYLALLVLFAKMIKSVCCSSSKTLSSFGDVSFKPKGEPLSLLKRPARVNEAPN